MITTDYIRYPKIPQGAGQVTGWKEIPINDRGVSDPLVPLGPLSREAIIFTSSAYFGEHDSSPYAKPENKLKGSLLTLFVRQSVARRLLTAEQLLPAGYHLLVFDTYRPYQVQKSLYDFYKQKLKEKHPEMTNATLDAETQKYVSLPSTDPTRPSPHNTGGAVDVVIIKFEQRHEKEVRHIRSSLQNPHLDFTERLELEMQLSRVLNHGKMLEFGTAFDHGGEKSALAYYESKTTPLATKEQRARDNRRLLFKVMTQAGFQPYYAEWWHFNAPETQMGAAAAGYTTATFGAIDLSPTNTAHEEMRRHVFQHTGDPTHSEAWAIEIIAPQE